MHAYLLRCQNIFLTIIDEDDLRWLDLKTREREMIQARVGFCQSLLCL